MKRILVALSVALIAGCGSFVPRQDAPQAPAPKSAPAPESVPAAKGGYYKDDGPGASPPANLAFIPDAVPRYEPPHRFANRPYQVFGRDYVPLTSGAPFRQQGTASWYGKRYHGASTSSGEPYDMYAMSAAHPVLPIPSYARVTNLANGKQVVVRINDRGPFHAERIIDLSYTAAFKLGYAEAGSARVEVEAIVPGGETVAAAPMPAAPLASAVPGMPDATRRQGGVFLQLGAFGARENAESFRARMARELSWLSEAIEVFASGGLFRLQLGPYRTQDEARGVAERIFGELSLRPLVVVR